VDDASRHFQIAKRVPLRRCHHLLKVFFSLAAADQANCSLDLKLGALELSG
jgi:hypothetical protein